VCNVIKDFYFVVAAWCDIGGEYREVRFRKVCPMEAEDEAVRFELAGWWGRVMLSTDISRFVTQRHVHVGKVIIVYVLGPLHQRMERAVV
jgi:hypothetical protein